MTLGFRRSVVAGVLTTLALGAAVAIGATPAQAIGGSCDSTRQSKKDSAGFTVYRAGAICSSLNADTKARAKLIRDLGPDYTSGFFTALNVMKYTGWYTCYAGCHDGYEIEHV